MKIKNVFILALLSLFVFSSLPAAALGATGNYGIVAQPGALEEGSYSTLESALEYYQFTGSNYIKVLNDTSEDLLITEDVYLDLNGCVLSGDITVNEGCTLYCMDTQTDDYDVEDGNGYGKLTGEIPDTVQAVEAGCGVSAVEQRNQADATPYRAGYLQVTENGETSFHRVDLDITHAIFTPDTAGISYQSPFSGDQVVARAVSKFGVALSLVGYPTAENLESDCKYSALSGFVAGKEANIARSSKLVGVMAQKNGYLNNSRNAQLPIYGSAYILTDGGYLFGAQKQTTLKQLVEQASASFSTQTANPLYDSTLEMFATYRDVMATWSVNNLEVVARVEELKGDDGVLKLLNIGNSHGQDSAWLLYDVLEKELPGVEILVADLYFSGALEEHVDNAKNDAEVYHYYENTSGEWEDTPNVTVAYGLAQNHWDVVTFNESSRHLGLEWRMEKGLVDWFADYIDEHLDYEPELVYNMTWSNPTDMTLYEESRQQPTSTFVANYTSDYGFDRVRHYNRLVQMTKQYIEPNENFGLVLHLATPVQYATEVLHVPQADSLRVMDMYRDYTHLSDFARLMVAYMWYAEMFGVEEITEVKVDVIPQSMRATYREKAFGDLTITQEHKDIIIESVNHALKKPLYVPQN